MDELKYGKKDVEIVPVPSGGGLYRIQFTTGGEVPAALQGTYTSTMLARGAVVYADAHRANQEDEPTTRELEELLGYPAGGPYDTHTGDPVDESRTIIGKKPRKKRNSKNK